MKEISPWRIRRMAEPEEIEPEYIHAAESDEFQLLDYWNILVKRRRVILTIFAVVFLIGAYFTFSATTLYTATATVKIEPQNPHVTGVGGVQPVDAGGGQYDYYQTEFALLQSRSLAARVVSDLDLGSNKTFRNARVISPNPFDHLRSWLFRMLRYFSYYVAPLFRSEPEKDDAETAKIDSAAVESMANTGGRPAGPKVPPYLIGQYLGFLDVNPVRNTRLVKVEFTTPDPALSQILANGHVEGFMRMSLESRFSLTKEARDFLEQKKSELREKLESAEGALNVFRRQHGVISVEKGENIVVDRLLDLNKRLTDARAQRIDTESLYRTVEKRNYQDLAQVMKEGLVQQLKSNVAALEADKARLATIFKPEHPRIQDLNRQIADARGALGAEIASVVRGIRSGYAAALAKEQALEAEAGRQQEDALRLRELGVDYTVLQEEVNANRSLYESVLKRLSETNVSNDLAVSNMQIAERAERPRGSSSPNIPFFLLASMFLGGVFGVGFAFLQEYVDSTVSTPEEVWRAVGLSTLGVVPHLKFLNRRTYNGGQIEGIRPAGEESDRPQTDVLPPAKELIISHSPISIMSESYRTIRASLLLSQAEQPPQVVLLTSPAPGEGKTVTTLNLAIALAHDGYSVLVIDGDMRKGRCHNRLGLRNSRGLSNVLTGGVTLEEGIQKTSVRGLSLLSRGVMPPNPSELLGSHKMKEILQELRQSFKFILIDSPPVIAVSDAAVLSVLTDGVLLVFDGQTTSTASAGKAVERLEMVRARLLGAILNGVNLDNPDYSYYRSYSSYYEQPMEEELRSDAQGEEVDEEASYINRIIASTEDHIEEGISAGKGGGATNGRGADANGSGSREAGVDPQPAGDASAGGRLARGEKRGAKPGKSTSSSSATPTKGNEPDGEAVSQEFFDRIVTALTEAVGPIAPLIVRDQLSVLGESQDSFPRARVDELFQLLRDQIANEQLKVRFQNKVSAELQSLGAT